MDIIICDICGQKIERIYSYKTAGQEHEVGGARLQFPLFTHPEKWNFHEIDLCMGCGLEFTKAYMDLKEKRGARKR